jgi:hypothetical protein
MNSVENSCRIRHGRGTKTKARRGRRIEGNYFQISARMRNIRVNQREFLGLAFPANWRDRAYRERGAEIVERESATVGLIRSVFG